MLDVNTVNMKQNQIDFLLEYFFQHNTKAVGWRDIAIKLITTGTCIIAGGENPWLGGIGNFIRTRPEPDAYMCTVLSFNLDEFKQSELFKMMIDTELKGII